MLSPGTMQEKKTYRIIAFPKKNPCSTGYGHLAIQIPDQIAKFTARCYATAADGVGSVETFSCMIQVTLVHVTLFAAALNGRRLGRAMANPSGRTSHVCRTYHHGADRIHCDIHKHARAMIDYPVCMLVGQTREVVA